jgi:hypothetical protein
MRSNIFKLLVLLFCTFAGISAFSQESPPPPGNHGTSGNKAPGGGGGAPVDGGIITLTLLVGAYSGYKWFRYRSANRT